MIFNFKKFAEPNLAKVKIRKKCRGCNKPFTQSGKNNRVYCDNCRKID